MIPRIETVVEGRITNQLGTLEDGIVAVQDSFGIDVSGDYAASELTALLTPEESALAFAKSRPITDPNSPFRGMYDVYHRGDGVERFEQMRAELSGRTVLMPIPSAQDGGIRLCPVVLDSTEQAAVIRLTVLDVHAQLTSAGLLVPDQKVLIDGAVQAASSRIGEHGHTTVAAEPGHLLSVFAGALQPDLASDILHGQHVVHNARGVVETNVVERFSVKPANGGQTLFNDTVSSKLLQHTTWPAGLRLLWSGRGDQVESANLPTAIPLIQGLGYLSLYEANAVEKAKALIEVMQ